MWVLDLLSDASSGVVENTFYLVAGEWSIGRKKCHFNFQADASISRTHALLRVGTLSLEQLKDPATRPSLELVDQSSRFGSFVNREQCFSTRELKNGDHVSFGAKRTILRVRYQVFILVASRIQRVNRARVGETCQQIGMHLVAHESKDATHCIMDPGKVVATIKVLWALVYNQPVVCTTWIYAVLARKSMSEPLPRCEEFLPVDDPNQPSVACNYLPSPMRKTLYSRHVVVFLAPQAMEDIIAAMAGVVIAAYRDSGHDEVLLREIEQHATSRHVLIVEPLQMSGFSSAVATASDVREPPPHSSSNGGGSGSTISATSSVCALSALERRATLFRAIGASFVTVQELAASVIFAKAPATATECSFSSSLAGYHQSSSMQLCSFPEHLSLPVAPSTDRNDRSDNESHKQQTLSHAVDSNSHVVSNSVASDVAVGVSLDRLQSSTSDSDTSNTTWQLHKPESVEPNEPVATDSFAGESLRSVDSTRSLEPATAATTAAVGMQVKAEPTATHEEPRVEYLKYEAPAHSAPLSSNTTTNSHMDDPTVAESSQLSTTNVLSLDPLPKSERVGSNSSHNSRAQDRSSGWIAVLSSMPRRLANSSRDSALNDNDSAKVNGEGGNSDSDSASSKPSPKPIVVSCSLVVKRPVDATDPNYSNNSNANNVNFKRFRKSAGQIMRAASALPGASSSTSSSSAAAAAPPAVWLEPPAVASVVVDNADRVALEANLTALEEQERIADELFAMAEHRTTKRRF